jgi:hypothetical protein
MGSEVAKMEPAAANCAYRLHPGASWFVVEEQRHAKT